MFGDLDKEQAAIRKLETLKQANRPMATLISELVRLAANMNINDSGLRRLFYNSLSDDLKDELSKVIHPPDSLVDYYTLA